MLVIKDFTVTAEIVFQLKLPLFYLHTRDRLTLILR